jgi:hypothetical protein
MFPIGPSFPGDPVICPEGGFAVLPGVVEVPLPPPPGGGLPLVVVSAPPPGVSGGLSVFALLSEPQAMAMSPAPTKAKLTAANDLVRSK